jgi:rubredoxin
MEKHNYQCVHCGYIKQIHQNDAGSIYSDIYHEVYCPKCGTVTPHLDIGQDIFDKYMLYDYTLDERFFKRNKTK